MKIFAFALLLVICVIARSPMPYDSEVLEIFNRERHLAGVPNLTFSTDLADKAQEYANRCNSSLSATKGVGEIVIRGFGVSEADAPKLMAALLVAEGRDWNCTTDVCISGACTHHRQIIWETTTEVGCGFSHCGTKGYQLVCRFTTFGNLYNTHPLANHGCPSGSKKRYGGGGGGRGWGSGGLGSSCLSGWGNSGWGNSKTTSSSWSTSSQPSGWGSPSGSPSGNSWDSSSSPSPSPSPSGWGGSPSGNSWSTSSGGWNGNGGSGELSQGGWRLSQTSTDATALTNNELWAFWYTQGRKIVVDPGFVSHVDGTIIPVPGGSLQVISWQDQVLEVHNAERASYGLPPLKWDGALAAGAQEFSTNCDIKLSGIRGLGENIAIGSGPVDKANVPKLLTALWTSEVFDWNCTTDKCTSDFCSHHRQIIWDETTKVGCGFSSCGTQGHILVCRYDPAGNTRGRHPLQSHGLDACTVQPNQENSTKRYGGGGSWGSSAGCGGLLASCLNGYGLISTQSSGWGSSSSPSSDSWGSSDSSSWGSPSGSWSSSNNEGSSSSGWRQSSDSSGWTNSWGSVGSVINAVPSWLSKYTSVVSGAANAVSAAAAGVKESVNQVKDAVEGAVNNVQQAGAGNSDPADKPADAGNANAGNADAGNADAGNTDAGNANATNADATNADSGNADAGNTDPADAGNADPAQKRSIKKRTWGATSNPSGGWGSSNVWGGHSSSTESCASPSSGWSNQPASSSFSGGWRIGYGGGSSSSGSSWSKGSAGSSSSWSSSPSSSSSSSWSSSSSSTSSCSALQDTNSGWPGGSAGWTAPSSSWSSKSSGWRMTTGQGEVVTSNNPVFQWWTLDGRSVRIDPGFTSDEEGNINANDGEPVSSVQYIGALPKTTAIAVIVVCSVCGVLLVAVVVVFLVKRRPSSMETA